MAIEVEVNWASQVNIEAVEALALTEQLTSIGGLSLTQKSATSGGRWGPMDGAVIMQLGTDFYMAGGWFGDNYSTDWTGGMATNLVYKTSNNGQTWSVVRAHDLTPDATHFTPRHTSAFVVHSVSGTEYMYLFCGDNSIIDSDVRRSLDGITWTKVNSVQPGYHGYYQMAAGSLGGNLYLAGGHNSLLASGATNVVWKSTDNGATWTSLGAAPWASRFCLDRLPLHDGKLWVVSGGKYDNDPGNRVYYNDVWSFDGTTWTEVLANGHTQWDGRHYPNVFSFDGWLYISRGYNAENRSDTFRSRDGVTWFAANLPLLIASHADGCGVGSAGVLFASGNGYLFGTPVNTDSPSFYLETVGAGDVATGVAAMIADALSEIHTHTLSDPLLASTIEASSTVRIINVPNGTYGDITYDPNNADLVMKNSYPGGADYGGYRWLNSVGATIARIRGSGQIDASGPMTEIVSGSAVTLTVNKQLSIEATSNTTGNVVYRGDDGITRRSPITFA